MLPSDYTLATHEGVIWATVRELAGRSIRCAQRHLLTYSPKLLKRVNQVSSVVFSKRAAASFIEPPESVDSARMKECLGSVVKLVARWERIRGRSASQARAGGLGTWRRRLCNR